MLPKPNFGSHLRPNPVPNSVVPKATQSWFQYNPNQSLNQNNAKNQSFNNYLNYNNSYNYYNNYGQQSTPVGWHQNTSQLNHYYNNTNYSPNANHSYNNGFNHNFNQNFNRSYGQQNQWTDNHNKRFKTNDNSVNITNNSNNKKSFNCDPCSRWFTTEELYNNHLSEHIMCGLDECIFKAHPKVIESHQRMQHFCFKDKTLVKKFMTLDTEEEIEKWREERRKNFPTKDNVIKREEMKQQLKEKSIESKLKDNETKNINNKSNRKGFDKKSKKRHPKDHRTDQSISGNNRKLTLFQKLLLNDIQRNEEKIMESIELIVKNNFLD